MDIPLESWERLALPDRLRLLAYHWYGESLSHPGAQTIHDAADLLEDLLSRAGPLVPEPDGSS